MMWPAATRRTPGGSLHLGELWEPSGILPVGISHSSSEFLKPNRKKPTLSCDRMGDFINNVQIDRRSDAGVPSW